MASADGTNDGTFSATRDSVCRATTTTSIVFFIRTSANWPWQTNIWKPTA